jgi:hypothetical protein
MKNRQKREHSYLMFFRKYNRFGHILEKNLFFC